MEAKTIRVAQVIGRLCKAGVESVINSYYKNIDHTKIQFDYFVDDDSPLKGSPEIEEMGVRYFYVPTYKHPIAYIKTLTKLFKENGYYVVHTNMGTLAPLSMLAAKKASVPVRIAHIHSTSSPKNKLKNLLKLILRPFGACFTTDLAACSNHAAQWMYKKQYEKGGVKIINNAIDTNRFAFDEETRNTLRTELGIQDKFVVGNVGRLCKDKNQSFLLEVFSLVCKNRSHATLILIGMGELEEELKEKAKVLGIENYVKFLGAKEDVERYYQAMDVFVFPSLYEGFGLVGLEAQTSGLPCIFADTISKEAIVLDTTKVLSLSAEPKIWAEEISSTKTLSPAERNASAEKIRLAGFDIKSEAKKLEEYYAKLIDKE